MRWTRAYFAVQATAGAIWWCAVATVPLVREGTLGGLDAPGIAALDLPLFVVAGGLAAAGFLWAAWVTTVWTCLVAAGLAVHATLTGQAGWGAVLMAGAAGCSALVLVRWTTGALPTRWIASGPFAVRTASRRTRPGTHVAATAAQIAVFWGFFLVVVPLPLRALEHRWAVSLALPPAVQVGGAVAILLASGLGLWAAAVMSTEGDGTPLPAAAANRLVIVGPYRSVRNPMAVSGIAQGVGVGLVLSSWFVVVYALLGAAVWQFAVRPLEEEDLTTRFGDPYRRYRAAARCWIPGRPARILAAMAAEDRATDRVAH